VIIAKAHSLTGGVMLRTYKTVHTEIQELDAVACNKCGVSKSNIWDTFISIDKTWAYGTGWDGETHSFDLCERCYGDMIAQFTLAITRSE
jgi:hypothetical protein